MMTTNAPKINAAIADAISHGQYIDIFSVLGMHRQADSTTLVVSCFLPQAISVDVIDLKTNRKLASLEQLNSNGFYSAAIPRRKKPFIYLLRVTYPLSVEEIIDPYQFASLLNDKDVYLFNEGNQLSGYQFQGANWASHQGIEGVHFCLWAPNAKQVSLVGDMNHWDARRHRLRRHPASGLWDIFIPDAKPLMHYKFSIELANGHRIEKSDPYATMMQAAPGNASVIAEKEVYQWQDDLWLTQRKTKNNHLTSQSHQQPMSIYEVQLASWRRCGELGQDYYDYQQLINELIPYVLEMGFTHLQLMPISEYPFDGSWGYQPVGLYAPTYRFGQPSGLKAFIDQCHQQGLAVLLDWVPAHFPKDPHGLAHFDGTCLYEHADPRLGEHPDWDTLIFNYGRAEVQSFLLSNAHYWLSEFHFDGLRLDAVSSMLYLDYSRAHDQWLPNEQGGRENLAAIAFLKRLNRAMYAAFPGIDMIAEESTAWSGVTQSTEHHGLGFGYKWNMGWMNDTLTYLRRDPLYRRYHHNELTFGLVYAFTEQFILSLSHDEVVHGKGALIAKIPGDDWQKFATLRAYFGFMWAHPGKKLLFMGSEFAQRNEWDHNQSLDWHLLEYSPHQGIQDWVRDLNHFYQATPALFALDHQHTGFSWLDCHNDANSVLVLARFAQAADQHVVVVVNMTPEVHHGFRIGLPEDVIYEESLNSDKACYNGSNVVNDNPIKPQALPWQGQPCSALITVPPLACLFLTPMDVNTVLPVDIVLTDDLAK
ncbi:MULTISPECIES: 1,4-alpha-glucan branching protein GlgB [Pseudomonadati]|uniref:1,4-alpha-glucan branching enzyme GlgB n=1 Tax=Shewanella aestuarii TaxID=1028752 RepID=A0ABT0KXA3_9GAMM|nr:1,4-alpha-glucan branching protein GlgB [Shewanella aestuarii]MCL1116096.1 1,4-alpha-glucan branching protein GlgB [Shewanella aestuarii]